MTVAVAIDQANRRLSRTTDSPRLDAEVLLAHVCRSNRTSLHLHPERPLTPAQWRRYRTLIERRQRGSPIAYLTETANFHGLTFRVNPSVLIPRPFTETLVEALAQRIPMSATTCAADIGTGCGAIAITLATLRPRLHLIATDLSTAALRLARGNARHLGVASRVTFRHGSLLEPLRRRPHPSIVIANLPYLTGRQRRAPSLRHEPTLALVGGHRGDEAIERLVRELRHHPTIGLLAVEFDPRQRRRIATWLRTAGFRHQTYVSDGRRIRGLITER